LRVPVGDALEGVLELPQDPELGRMRFDSRQQRIDELVERERHRRSGGGIASEPCPGRYARNPSRTRGTMNSGASTTPASGERSEACVIHTPPMQMYFMTR
jgi:hypothetical protein